MIIINIDTRLTTGHLLAAGDTSIMPAFCEIPRFYTCF